MAQSRRKQRVEPEVPLKEPAKPEDAEAQESLHAIPELMRRAIALGLTGFFTTEEAVRRALGDTVPKDWSDYIAESSDRTRSEFLDRLSREIAPTIWEPAAGQRFGSRLKATPRRVDGASPPLRSPRVAPPISETCQTDQSPVESARSLLKVTKAMQGRGEESRTTNWRLS